MHRTVVHGLVKTNWRACPWSRHGQVFAFALLALACRHTAVASPQAAAAKWAQAVRAGDAKAVRRLLSAQAQRQYSPERVAALLTQWKPELRHQVRDVSADDARTEVSARVVGTGNWAARLVAVESAFRVDSAATLPSAARRPEDALQQLRLALEHRSHSALLRVLTHRAALHFESKANGLVTGLADLDSAQVVVRGRTATAQLPGGHEITLRNEAGIWKIKTFD